MDIFKSKNMDKTSIGGSMYRLLGRLLEFALIFKLVFKMS